MRRKSANNNALLDLGLTVSIPAAIAVMVTKEAFSPGSYSGLVVGLVVLATALGWWREWRKEKQLDELELAAVSFGARWSMAALGAAVLLLLFASPLHEAIVEVLQAYDANVESKPMPAPAWMFVLGFVCALFLQLTARSALAAIWKWTKR